MEIVEQYMDKNGKRQWFTLKLTTTENSSDDELKEIISKITILIHNNITKSNNDT